MKKRLVPFLRMFTGMHSFWVLVVLLVLCAGFALLTPPGTFFSPGNFKAITADGAEMVILTIGTTFILIAGGLDLSIGSVLVLDTVVTLRLIKAMGGYNAGVEVLIVGTLFSIIFGVLIGLFNGFLVTRLKIPAFIATLGTMGAALGFARLISDGTNLVGVPYILVENINLKILGIPLLAFIALFVALTAHIVLRSTGFGLYTYAIGSNAEASRRAGINVDRQLLLLYALNGAFVGIATILDLGRFGVASIAAHTTDAMQAIAGAVIGGTSLFGGRGSIPGSIVGAFIPAVLRNGFIIMGLQPFWQEVAVSFVLLAAVYFDQFRRAGMQTLQASLLEPQSPTHET